MIPKKRPREYRKRENIEAENKLYMNERTSLLPGFPGRFLFLFKVGGLLDAPVWF